MNTASRHNFKATQPERLNFGGDVRARETAQYVADMLLELRNMAKAAELKTVQGLLELAYYEAYSQAHRPPLPEGEAERLEKLGEDARKAESS